jgi:pimeloyl-ACP methyl ester carboxylesterase
MFDAKTYEKYFKDVPENELETFRHFLVTHPSKHIELDGQRVRYLSSGQGDGTVLLPPGGGGGIFPPELGFRSILNFEQDYRVIAPGSAVVRTLDELSAVLNLILQAEGIENVIVVGGSGAGITAQTYFKRNASRVEAMILYNTLAPRRERNKNWARWMLRVLPASTTAAIAKKRLATLFPSDVPDEAKGRIALTRAFLSAVTSEAFNKKVLLSFVDLVFEFNESDGYSLNDFKNWSGKTLIMTCENDPGFEDTDYLTKNLPNTSLYTFPKEQGHLAPLIHIERFNQIVKDFLRD